MAGTLTVRDETTAGQTLHEFALAVLTERLTVSCVGSCRSSWKS
jgi:hypothetical protein